MKSSARVGDAELVAPERDRLAFTTVVRTALSITSGLAVFQPALPSLTVTSKRGRHFVTVIDELHQATGQIGAVKLVTGVPAALPSWKQPPETLLTV